MEITNLRYQIALFGNYDDVRPNIETIKFFIDTFGDKQLIPSQYQETGIEFSVHSVKNINTPRLTLTTPDAIWNIKFSSDRLDIISTNSDINKVLMPDLDGFLIEAKDILDKLNSKILKKNKRVGFVSQYLIRDTDSKATYSKANKLITFFNEKPLVEWNNKVATRLTIMNDEFINVSNEQKWNRIRMKIDGKIALFEGILLNIDCNSVAENENYRFGLERTKQICDEFKIIHNSLKEQNINLFK